MEELAITAKGVNKSFPGVHALIDVDFALRKGEVHALLGENGAGKSTLIKAFSGVHKIDSGEITVHGNPVDIRSIRDADALGIKVIYQELALAENMTIAENIFMGHELIKKSHVIDTAKMLAETQDILNRLGTNLKAQQMVETLSIAQKQMVEIVKAISADSGIIMMDEPTASLSGEEVAHLFQIIRDLKSRGFAIVYISHRMEELFEIADRVTVMRDGKTIGTRDIDKTDKEELIHLMVGRSLGEFYHRDYIATDEVVFETKGVTNSDVTDISMQVKKGEIVGFAGLIGAGRTEFANALFGIDPAVRGEIILEGETLKISNPDDAIKSGIALVPESRKDHGLILIQTTFFNITLCVLEKFISKLRVKSRIENSIIKDFVEKLKIKISSRDQLAVNLSGGNQQKIVLAKWLATNPRLLILDEPTRGIDVGTKSEFYVIMNNLVKQGTAIIMISSEMPELMGMCDRIYVMSNGRVSACLDRSEYSQETILGAAIKYRSDSDEKFS